MKVLRKKILKSSFFLAIFREIKVFQFSIYGIIIYKKGGIL